MRKLSIIHLVAVLCLGVFAYSINSSANQKDGLLKIYFLDVGQGDGLLIESPTGNQVLVDGGPSGAVLEQLVEVMPFYDHDLDAVVATHPHLDHIGGLVPVLERYDVGVVIQASVSYHSSAFGAWEKAVESENAKKVWATAGLTVDLGGGAELIFLYPFNGEGDTRAGEGHEHMAVTLLKYKNFKLLLTGDMEAGAERELAEKFQDLIKADVLKVGHHGSKTSTTENFLRAVSPQVAVIQVGAKNRYGHPAPITLNRLENFGIRYYRNDTDGAVKLISDGQSFKVSKY